MDLTRRRAGKWIVDFGWDMSEAEAALYEAPFGHVKECVWPSRQRNRASAVRKFWWRHERPRPEMWQALDGLSRYIVTPTVAKHRLFDWMEAGVCPDHQLIVIARDANDPHAVAIADAARRLVERRDRWINPPEWVEWVDEPVPGYPKRPVARNEPAAKELKTRTLTNLYNAPPQWLADAHSALDASVAAAYGWDAGISEDAALCELLKRNLSRGPTDRTD